MKPVLGPLVRLGIESDGDLYILGGAGKDCSIRYISYSTDGAVTGQTNKPQEMWYGDPRDRDQIQAPSSAKAAPCKGRHVAGLASLSRSDAAVVCTDGAVLLTSDSGKSWKVAGELVGTMAVGAGGGRYWVVGKGENCDGAALRSLSLMGGKISIDRTFCIADLPLTPGKFAVDVSGKAIWLWAGDTVQVSTDAGRTWKSQ